MRYHIQRNQKGQNISEEIDMIFHLVELRPKSTNAKSVVVLMIPGQEQSRVIRLVYIFNSRESKRQLIFSIRLKSLKIVGFKNTKNNQAWHGKGTDLQDFFDD